MSLPKSPRQVWAKAFQPIGGRAGLARGFTLLEVLLAFVLLAAAMGLLLAMLSRGLRQVQQAQRATEATLYAQSLLDALGVLEPIEPAEREGDFAQGRYRYRLEIAEVDDPAPRLSTERELESLPAAHAPKIYRIALVVSWGAAGPAEQLSFVSLRVRTPEVLP